MTPSAIAGVSHGRRAVKALAASALSWSGVPNLMRAAPGHSATALVMCYHRVVEHSGEHRECGLPAMTISVGMLERHLDWLGRHFDIVSLDDLVVRARVERTGPKRIAAVTFDDGYADAYHHALPLLRRRGIPAAFFVISDLIGGLQIAPHERLYAALHTFISRFDRPDALVARLRQAGVDVPAGGRMQKQLQDPFATTGWLLQRLSHSDVEHVIQALDTVGRIVDDSPAELRPLTWEMLRAIRDAGMTIGSHTMTHAILTNERIERVVEEAAASRATLERALQINIEYFAYPAGCFNRAVVEAVAQAGYGAAFTICQHRDVHAPWLTMPRTVLWEQSTIDSGGRFSSAIMQCQAAGMFSARADCRQTHHRVARAWR